MLPLLNNVPGRLTLIGVTSLALITGCDTAAGTVERAPLDMHPNDVILAWNTIAFDALTAIDEYANPLVATRVYSMMHIAQHDALNAIDPVFASYAAPAVLADRRADPVAAAASAAHGVLSVLLPQQASTLDEALATALAAVPDSAARVRGVNLGARAAAAILALRARDGSDTPVVGDYEPGVGAGRYQPTPPFGFTFASGWKDVQPFGLTTASQFRAPAPPALHSAAYGAAFNEVKAVGSAGSTTRTAEQSAYAKFWYEFSDIGWNRVARVVAAERGLGLQSTARLFALLNIAMADAYIAGWDSKFHYDLWRPYTAIREAAADGNDATAPDASWEPALPTPPVQDYPSTHSALGNAAAAVLASVFGDNVSFTFHSTTAEPAQMTRSFTSFSQAADENADSRVRGGLHFRFACEAGQELGSSVGRWVVANHMLRRR